MPFWEQLYYFVKTKLAVYNCAVLDDYGKDDYIYRRIGNDLLLFESGDGRMEQIILIHSGIVFIQF